MSLLRDLVFTFRGFFETFGAMSLFFLRLVAYTPRALSRRMPLIIAQVYNSGALSLVLIMISGFFVGMVLGLQGFDTLARFNSEDSLGAVTALALLKELGPVITALLFAGRAGTALASEIGLMKATDQLSAMEMMAVDPLRRVVVPRFLGGVVAMPLLAAVFSTIGLAGAFIIGVGLMDVDSGVFWSQMRNNVDPADVWEGVFKSFAFGISASLLAVFEGYNCVPTADGVGQATTRTVVQTAISVLVLDYIITAALL
jgi:phospholipid/cholesterol/gamma-HCH transport system permease protein